MEYLHKIVPKNYLCTKKQYYRNKPHGHWRQGSKIKPRPESNTLKPFRRASIIPFCPNDYNFDPESAELDAKIAKQKFLKKLMVKDLSKLHHDPILPESRLKVKEFIKEATLKQNTEYQDTVEVKAKNTRNIYLRVNDVVKDMKKDYVSNKQQNFEKMVKDIHYVGNDTKAMKKVLESDSQEINKASKFPMNFDLNSNLVQKKDKGLFQYKKHFDIVSEKSQNRIKYQLRKNPGDDLLNLKAFQDTEMLEEMIKQKLRVEAKFKKIRIALVKLIRKCQFLKISVYDAIDYELFVTQPNSNKISTDFFALIKKGDKKAMKELYKENKYLGFDVDTNGMTALHHACKRSDYDMAKLIMDNKCDVDKIDFFRKPPLYYALRIGDAEISKLLISNRADVKNDKVNDFSYETVVQDFPRVQNIYRKTKQMYLFLAMKDCKTKWEIMDTVLDIGIGS